MHLYGSILLGTAVGEALKRRNPLEERQIIKPVDVLETEQANRSAVPNGNTERLYRSSEPNDSTEQANRSDEPNARTERINRSNEPNDNTEHPGRSSDPSGKATRPSRSDKLDSKTEQPNDSHEPNAKIERMNRSPKSFERTVKPNALNERINRTVFDDLEEGTPEEAKRPTERYSFEIYTDQKGSIEEVQYLYKKKTGKKLSASRIIREALEDYLTRAMEALRQEE